MLHTKELILFDVDDTLVASKCEMTDDMCDAFGELLKHIPVGIVTGGKWEIIKKNIIDRLEDTHSEHFHRLHILPTCGARYTIYKDGAWVEKYAHTIPEADKKKITELLEHAVADEYDRKEMYGDLIEDRGTQVTLSMFGQSAPIEVKDNADRDQSIRKRIVAKIAHHLPDYDMRIGGATSIDVTQKGIDKGFAIRKISEELGIDTNAILFVGDAVYPGGNDYPAVATGVHVIAVRNEDETLEHIKQWLSDK